MPPPPEIPRALVEAKVAKEMARRRLTRKEEDNNKDDDLPPPPPHLKSTS